MRSRGVLLVALLAALAAPAPATAALSHARAVARALQILHPARERGMDGSVKLFGFTRPLRPGTRLSEATTGRTFARALRPAWLFWEDLGHGLLFPHASKLLVLDAHGRVALLRNLQFFPMLNDRLPAFMRTPQRYLGSLAVPANAVPAASRARARASPRQIRGAQSGLGDDGVVTVGAREDPTFANDFKAVDAAATKLKVPNVAAKPSTDGLREAIAQMVKEHARHDIFVFIGGHGSPAKDHTYVDENGQTQVSAPGRKLPLVSLDDAKHEDLTSIGLVDRVIKRFPNITFKIVIASCFSSRFQEPLQAVPNVKLVITSARVDEFGVNGFGEQLMTGLLDLYSPAGANGGTLPLVDALRRAVASAPVLSYVQAINDQLPPGHGLGHPQVSPPAASAPAPEPPPAPAPPPKPPPPFNYYLTWNDGSTSGNVCVYLVGPPGQTGTVKVTGPAVKPPDTQSFTLDANNHALLVFGVNEPGTYTVNVNTTSNGQPDSRQNTVTVQNGGSGPGPPPAYDQTPCPTPP